MRMKSPFLLHQLLDDAAGHAPTQEAVRFWNQSLTFEDLARRSTSLAHVLIQHGVRKGDRVGVFMEKSLEAVIAIYGIMKAGAAYVPIDRLAPLSRLGFIIRDCGVRHLISSQSSVGQLQELLARGSDLESIIGVRSTELPVVCIPWDEVDQAPPFAQGQPTGTELDLAYILYTSGSTGEPKGVMHTHRSALSFVQWAVKMLSLSSSDRLSNHAPYNFDLSILDLFASCAVAASVVIIPEDVARLPASLSKLISDEKLTVWYSVPFALIQLLQRGRLEARDLTSLRFVLFAGEPFPPKHLRQLMLLLPRASFFNLYGPTETNVCTFYEVPPRCANDPEALPIGQACANTELLVVDGQDRMVAPGEIGELLVRGPSTMLGYWNRPEQTDRAFFRREVRPPFQEVFYRTGDVVQLGESNNYQFLGRKDRQIKVRGFRIELDEIELALLAHDQVEEAAAYLVPDPDGQNRVEAAVVAKNGADVIPPELSGYLAQRLPPYAVPARIVTIDKFPRTSTGKIDRRTLQDQAANTARSSGVGSISGR